MKLPVLGVAFLTLGLNSLLAQSAGNAPPPVLIQEILEGISSYLDKNVPLEQGSARKIDIPIILRFTAEKLGIELGEGELAKAAVDWKAYLGDNQKNLEVGSNSNRAKRVLLWTLQWLYRNGHNPGGESRPVISVSAPLGHGPFREKA